MVLCVMSVYGSTYVDTLHVVAAAGAHPVEWLLAFALHETGDQVDLTLGLGGYFSGDMETKLLQMVDDL